MNLKWTIVATVTVVVEQRNEPTEAECEEYIAVALQNAQERNVAILDAKPFSIEHVGFQAA